MDFPKCRGTADTDITVRLVNSAVRIGEQICLINVNIAVQGLLKSCIPRIHINSHAFCALPFVIYFIIRIWKWQMQFNEFVTFSACAFAK